MVNIERTTSCPIALFTLFTLSFKTKIMINIKYILKHRPLKDGRHRVAMRIIKDRKKKVISLNITCFPEDFHDERLRSTFRGYKKKNSYLRRLLEKADDIIETYQVRGLTLTLDKLVAEIFNSDSEELSIWESFDRKINSIDIKPKTAKAYNDTKNSLKRFHTDELLLGQITPEFLENYISHLRCRKSNDGGVKFFLTHLRVIVRLCAKLNKKHHFINPFNEISLSKLNNKPKKRALSLNELRSLLKVDLEERPDLQESYKMALFSFYCRGINFVDLIYLKWSDFSDDVMTYRRRKTGKLYRFKLLPPALNILNKYKQERTTEFVFPIIKYANLDPLEFEKIRERSLRKYNKDLKNVAKICKIDSKISSYTLRHTYATVMKNLNISTDIISEAMGHSDLKVTQNYLKEFGNDVLDKEHEKLLDI